MAFVNKDQDEEELLRQQQGQGTQLAGEQGNLEGGGALSGFTSPNKTGTSGFVDVHAYLDANKDQAQDIANKVGANVGQQVDATRGKIQAAQGAFDTGVEKGTVKNNPDLIDSAFKDPSGFVKDPNNVSGFKNLRDAIYGGPKQFESINEYTPASSAVAEGKRIAGSINAPQGREELLYRLGQNPTKGNVALDSLLLGGDENARKTLETSTKPFNELDTFLQDTTKAENEKAGAAAAETAGTRNAAQSRLDAETAKFQTDLDARLGTARTEAQKNADFLKAGIESGHDLNDSELSATGMNREQWNELLKTKGMLETDKPFGDTQASYGQKFNLGDYFNAQNPDASITKENFASADDYAKEKALQQLADNGQFDALPDDASKAGTAPTNLGKFSGADAYTNAKGKLGALDQQFLDQYKNFDLGWGSEGDWLNLLKDPNQAKAYKGMVDIIRRNPEHASDFQRQIADQLDKWITQSNALGPNNGGGGDGFTVPDEGAQSRLRIQDGQMNWWDGKSWVKAPAETKVVDGKAYKFNYNTGQYEETTMDKIKIGAGGTDYVDPKTGQTSRAY